eukprot:gene18273-5319_t
MLVGAQWLDHGVPVGALCACPGSGAADCTVQDDGDSFGEEDWMGDEGPPDEWDYMPDVCDADDVSHHAGNGIIMG